MKIQKFNQTKWNITFNYYRIILFTLIYFFGFYGIGTIEPIWNNLDGLIYFWIFQLIILISIILMFTILLNISNTELNQKKFMISLTSNHIFTFILFLGFLLILNNQSISNDLAEDETSYAGYSVHHLDKILYDLNLSALSNVNVATLYRIGLLIFLLGGIFSLKLITVLTWKTSVILSFVLLMILRLTNQFYFKLNVYSLPYTDPLFFIHQIGIILFGYTSTGFRVINIVLFATFMLGIKVFLEKYYYFSSVKSIISSIMIISLPIVLSMTTKIDHGLFTYFSQVFMWLYIFSQSRISSKYIAPFLVSSVYCSLTSINIIITVFLFFLFGNVRRNQLRKHLKLEWKIYMFLAPIFSITILKAIKDWHLRPFISGYAPIPYEERLLTLLKTVPKAVGSIYVFTIVAFMVYLIYRKIFNRLFLLIYLLVTLFIYTFFVVITALNHNRYSFQLISSFLVVPILHFMKNYWNFVSIRTPISVVFILCNLSAFILFQRNYNNFDSYVKTNRWNYAVNYTQQPWNAIWPSTAYSKALKMQHNLKENGRVCVLLGLYYKAVPYSLSGSTLGYMRAIERYTSLPAHRLYLQNFNNYYPGDNWTFHKEVDCIIISNMYYKEEFLEFLLTQNWIINYSYESKNGIRVFTFQKSTVKFN